MSFSFRRIVLVLVLMAVPAPGRAAGPPAALTEAQQRQWVERNRFFAQASDRYQSGDLEGMASLVRRALAVERQVLGSLSAQGVGVLRGLAVLQTRNGRFVDAVRTWEERFVEIQRRHGVASWQSRDAWLDLDEGRQAVRRNRDDHRLLRLAQAESERVVELGKQDRWSDALPLARHVLAVRRRLLGEWHPETASAWFNLSRVHAAQFRLDEAERFLGQALLVRTRILGREHPGHAVTVMQQGVLRQMRGDYRQAYVLTQRAYQTLQRTVGVTYPDTIRALNNLATLAAELGDHRGGVGLMERVVALRRMTLGEDDPSYATSLNNLGRAYFEIGAYHQALEHFEQARAILEKVLGPRHLHHAESLNNLGMVYLERGDLPRARALVERAHTLRRAILGENHPEYAESLINLAQVYQQAGEHHRCRSLLEQACAIRKKVLGERHPDHAESQVNLAKFHVRMGDHDRARPLFEAALATLRATVGDAHPRYATALQGLAFLGEVADAPRQAFALYEQVHRIRHAVYGADHLFTAEALSMLALVHHTLGENDKAIQLMIQSLGIYRRRLGPRDVRSAYLLNNLGVMYLSLRDYHRARYLFEQARDLVRAGVGPVHEQYMLSQVNLARLNYFQGDGKRAEAEYREALAVRRTHLDAMLVALSDRQRLEHLFQARVYLDWYLSLTHGMVDLDDEVHQRVVDWKGLITRRHMEELLARDEPAVARLVERLRAVCAGLARLGHHVPGAEGLSGWRERFVALEEEKERLQRRLAEISVGFRRLQRPPLDDMLPPGTALVDILHYVHRSPNRTQGGYRREGRYVAFVRQRGQRAIRIDLGPSAAINEAVLAWRQSMQEAHVLNDVAARTLRQRLWIPLTRALGKASTVLLAPDGLLCGLPLGALPGSRTGSYLIEEVAIGQVAAGHVLPPTTTEAGRGLLVLGGLDYGAGKPWRQLPGTRFEAAQVLQVYREHFPRERGARILAGERGDRTGLLAEFLHEGKPVRYRYLHLATHGLFAQPSRLRFTRPSASVEELTPLDLTYWRNPQLLCGLVLAGANRHADGILSADEVASLDLRGCDLAVLSACESGLGAVASGEGPLGLQRAFHLAGARTVVCSLWSVSDPATSVLMEQFYRRLWGKKLSKLEALRQAQLYVLNHPRAVIDRATELRRLAGKEVVLRGVGKTAIELPQGGAATARRSHPAWWAAFVLSGDTGRLR